MAGFNGSDNRVRPTRRNWNFSPYAHWVGAKPKQMPAQANGGSCCCPTEPRQFLQSIAKEPSQRCQLTAVVALMRRMFLSGH